MLEPQIWVANNSGVVHQPSATLRRMDSQLPELLGHPFERQEFTYLKSVKKFLKNTATEALMTTFYIIQGQSRIIYSQTSCFSAALQLLLIF